MVLVIKKGLVWIGCMLILFADQSWICSVACREKLGKIDDYDSHEAYVKALVSTITNIR